MKKILFLLILAVFLASGVFVWQYFIKKSAPADETAGWKTYGNADYGYEIKYPSQLIQIERPPSDVYLSRVDFYKQPGDIDIRIEVNNSSLDQEVAHMKWAIVGHAADEIESETEIVHDGHPGVKLEYRLPTTGIFESVVIINNGEYSYSISALSDLIDKILSTFRFLQDKTAYWNTYGNGMWEFEVKYPSFLSAAYFPGADALGRTLIKFSNPAYLDYPDILIEILPTNLTPTEFVDNNLCKPLPSGNTLCTTPKPGLVPGSIQVGSQGTHFNSINTVFQSPKHNALFDISINEKLASPIPQNELEVYNQMLSTFRFLE